MRLVCYCREFWKNGTKEAEEDQVSERGASGARESGRYVISPRASMMSNTAGGKSTGCIQAA